MTLGDDVLGDEVRRALERRDGFHHDPDQTAYRLFHGYAEGRPGLTIDRYGEIALIAHKTEVEDGLAAIVDLLVSSLPVSCVIVKAHRYFNWDARALSVRALHGTLPDSPVEVRDNALRLLATPYAHQSNGLFLDARPARRWILDHARARRVLNLFAYTGSLGVAAGAGGARHVVHLDNKQNPLDLARENHRLNDLPVDDRGFLRGDVYRHLPRAAKAGSEFDGIILDPPPRVPERRRRGKRRPEGQDFPRLTALTVPLLAPDGWLLCFFHRFDRTRAECEAEVLDAAGDALEIEWRGTSGEDFPEDDPEKKLRLTVFRRA